ncbi:type II secretion system protein [Roseateles oligotrophus]|uniref:Type II secretion system GspH family protein n=1 Tax=Roseateles oligotrophus TaxID=1769250 RepID=A0ABT2YKH3_9BURK|nr:type II secretion system protein [Roseateles oligotrophus]MCV2370556.1 type II secretion system GspH family protein [Roseateles oligotrophus]
MSRQRGFTYLGLLFFVAITAAGLAALGQAWSTAAQRERERELEFRGNEIAQAIASYLKTSPGLAQYPGSLEDLLADRRGPKTHHHLRRAYADPFTGKADWVLVPDVANPKTFSAVHSRSERPLLRQLQADGTAIATAQDWVFAANTNKAAGDASAASPENMAIPSPGPASSPIP